MATRENEPVVTDGISPFEKKKNLLTEIRMDAQYQPVDRFGTLQVNTETVWSRELL